jgi:hypothetical protein
LYCEAFTITHQLGFRGLQLRNRLLQALDFVLVLGVETDSSIDFSLEIFDIVILSSDGPLQQFDLIRFRCKRIAVLLERCVSKIRYTIVKASSVETYFFELRLHPL